MKNGFSLMRSIFSVALAVLLAGCAGSPSVRFYTLTPVEQGGKGTYSPGTASPISVSIAPVEIPDYLERPQIVTRQGRNQLKLAEFDHWAGSLSDNFSAVLVENIATLLGSDRVTVRPGIQGGKPDFALALRILRLDFLPGDRVDLKAQWTIISGQDRKDIATRTMSCTESLADKSYDTMVAALSHALGQLSREIAQGIAAR
jgi:uncharacterized protein